MSLGKKIQQEGVTVGKKRSEPLWKGPEVDGVTYSLLSRFLVCRERFRLYAIEGLRPAPEFNHRIEYGHMWHVCEEMIIQGMAWEGALQAYAIDLVSEYHTAGGQIEHWYNVCRTQFPIYVRYWGQQGEESKTPLLQEQVFSIPYTLPSGRLVRLRGKWDSVNLVDRGVWLQENKTKGDVDEQKITRQLKFDLQTMLYLVALQEEQRNPLTNLSLSPIQGVRYNVVRRPLSGGKGSIVRHKPTKSNPQGESKQSFYSRLSKIIEEDPSNFFMRWSVEITQKDIERFKRECLNPILEQLCIWWSWVTSKDPAIEEYGANPHWRHPFGVYNVLDEGGSSELDNYLDTGNEIGLRRTKSLFEELE